ncbi:unnamed protein product [Dovyalis caffra]|uniref:HMA domain-containing protein n=1 Tax=Dovyalis caffra TaxID=77055 RepID=A0AAV1QR73_9ROSI|nr:unnamed protein product [Dovyalis caffra]
MQQKIVLKVQMNCERCRTKALTVAAEADGVNFLGLEGEKKEKVVVIGDGVDVAKLASCLRKKVGHTDIISVALQKIVLKVQMHCEKCRSKALTVAADADGVSFMGLEGEDKDKVVVIGDGVDSAALASRLRRKVGHTDIISIALVD